MADCCADIPDTLTLPVSSQGDSDTALGELVERISGPLDRFTNSVASRYVDAFSDLDVVVCARTISGRWDHSTESAEVVAKGDELLAASRNRSQELSRKLKDHPFIVIHRECKYPLRLAKDPSQAVQIMGQFQGELCPGCGVELQAFDIVTCGLNA
jgi:hypothetical protein